MDAMEKIYKLYDSGIKTERLHLISGESININISTIVGFCYYAGHQGYITVRLMKEHKCVEKNCALLKVFENMPYWREQRKQSEEKLRRKKLAQQQKYKKRKEEELLNNYKNEAQKIADEYGFKIKITSVIKKYERLFIIFFISENKWNDWYEYRDVYIKMEYLFDNRFIIKHIKAIDGSYVVDYDLVQ